MNTSYAAWAKYDVDDALARVDLLEQQEEITRQKQQKAIEKRRVEETISHDAEQSAEVLAAQAAVAALRAKSRSRGTKKVATPSSITPEINEDTDVKVLRQNAALVHQKHILIKTIMTARRRGDALLEENDWEAAKRAYERASTSTKELETMVPQLMEQQRRQGTKVEVEDTQQEQESHDHPPMCESHEHDHDHTHCASKSKQPTPIVTDPLPEKEDLGAVVEMFLKDCYMGIGACDMGIGHYAAASEAYKEVLVRDDNHLIAWLQRGRAFEALNAPLLAWLHYNRITNVDPTFEDAKECEERIKTQLLSETTRTQDAPAVPKDKTLKNMLHQVKLLMDAGNVIMVEGFFDYAITKYESTIEFLSVIRKEHNPMGLEESIVTKLETTCHLNVACCYLEMQKHLPSALKHCQLALENDPGHIVANFRLAQIHRAIHGYEAALEAYHTVRMLVAYLPRDEATKQLKKLDDELDKCQFERSQYDATFIRQEMQKESLA